MKCFEQLEKLEEAEEVALLQYGAKPSLTHGSNDEAEEDLDMNTRDADIDHCPCPCEIASLGRKIHPKRIG